MKFKKQKFLIIFYLILTICNNVFSSETENSLEDSHFEKEILRLKDIYSKNDNILSELVKDMELYTPNFNFAQPEKYRRESYWKLYNGDKSKFSELSNDIYVIPEELIEDTENINRKNMMDMLIKKELNIEEIEIREHQKVYGYPDAKSHQATTVIKMSESNNFKIKNFSEISEFISFDPKEIILQDKPILIPAMALISIRNMYEEEMIINSVKIDSYQMTIFYFKPGKDSNQSYNQKNVYPKVLLPGEEMLFQIIILPDMVGNIRGNIYFDIGKKIVVIYPILINAVENIYRVHPIYSPNWLSSKVLTIPLNIYNPHSKTLIIKEVINSFTSISLMWPNGDNVSSNNTSVSSSLLEIPPKTNKNIMVINFHKDTACAEYGLLQLKTDKDTIIIPVFIRVEIKTLQFFPNVINFGIIDLDQNIKRAVPISITNLGLNPIELKMIYINYDENLIEFIPNNNCKCFKKLFEQNKASHDYSTVSSKEERNLCLLNHEESIENFGYLILDPKKFHIEGPITKHVKGSLLLQTNFYENPFVELKYEYHIDRDIILPFYSYHTFFKNGQFVLPIPQETNGEKNYSLTYKLDFKFKSPFNISYTTISQKGYYYFYAQNNYFTNNNSHMSNRQLPIMELQDKDDFTRLVLTFENINQDYNNNNKNSARKIYHIPIPSNYDSFAIVPVKLVDNYVDVFCCFSTPKVKDFHKNNQIVVYRKVNKKNSLVTVNLDTISVSESGINYFLIINDNDKEINIVDVKTTNGDLVLGLESILDIETTEKISNRTKYSIDNETLQNSIRRKYLKRDNEKIPLVLTSNSITVFSVIMNSYTEQEMTETITMTFENTHRLFVNVNAKFLKGNLNISPTLIRFEPAFPGFYQHKFVSSKSSYNQPVVIHSVESKDQRIIPVLLTNQIIPNNRTEIIKINFDPSKVSLGENFMKEDFLFNTTTRYLTYKELYLWKEKQKLWELLGSQGRTEINTSVNIKTSIQSDTVQIRAFLTKPSLFKKDDIDFGLVQLGESSSKYIEVYNPSDEVITIQVLLATEEYADINNDSMFNKEKKFNLNRKNLLTLMDCQFFDSYMGNPIISLNVKQNTHSPRDLKKKKKKEEIDGFDLNNSIVIDEDLPNLDSIDGKSLKKSDILKKIFHKSGDEVQNSINYIKKVICNHQQMNKDEIILNRKELSDKLFSEEFNKEISVVKKMTDSPPPSLKKKINESSEGLLDNIAHFIKTIFKTEVAKKKKTNTTEIIKQDFYIPKIVSSQIYYVKPHQKMKIGPILFHPTSLSNSTATMFIKNNLTILYPIKLKGNGGSGMLSFSKFENYYDENGYLINREIEINDNNLTYVIYSNIPGIVIRDDIQIKNTGNLSVKINNVSIDNAGCDNIGLKISTCDSFKLKPDESFKISLTIVPDFNFYYSQKEIMFSTQYGPVVLKISVNIQNQLLSKKNNLFNYDILKNLGYISVLTIIFVICVILYFLSKEHEEMTEKKIKVGQSLSFMSTKLANDANPKLKFENLFVKAYRKFNHGFYDDFMMKQFDKPGTGNYDMESINDKKKLTNKSSKEKRTEDMQKEVSEKKEIISIMHNNIHDSNNNNVKLDKVETVTKENKEKLDKDNLPSKILKPTQSKKVADNKNRKTNKKFANRPIGMPINLKNVEKKDETNLQITEPSNVNTTNKKTTELNSNVNLINNTTISNNPPTITQNKDNPNMNTNYNLNNTHSQYTRYTTKDEFNNTTNNYNHYENNIDHNVYNNYWHKGHYNKQISQRYDYNMQNNRYNYYTKQYDTYYNHNSFNTGNKSFNHFNHTPKYNETLPFKSNPNKSPQNVGPNNETIAENNQATNQNLIESKGNTNINRDENVTKLKSQEETRHEKVTIAEIDKRTFSSLNSGIKEIESCDKFEIVKNGSEKNQVDCDGENLSQQNNSVLPDKIKDVTSNDNSLHHTKFETAKIMPSDDNLIRNFNNFDFSDIFNKPQEKLNQDDYKNLNEEDASSHNNQSEREKLDSGAEEFRFNFNSIFTNSKNNMMLPENFNDNTDNEDLKNANKPYFDKNLLFPAFDWNKSQNGFVISANPFSNNTNKKLLDELREENNDEEEVEVKGKHKSDDIADEDYDDEDPLWNADPREIKEEGYFDCAKMAFFYDFPVAPEGHPNANIKRSYIWGGYTLPVKSANENHAKH